MRGRWCGGGGLWHRLGVDRWILTFLRGFENFCGYGRMKKGDRVDERCEMRVLK
ncbi:hypothetical protein HanRHA438_Chr13g0608401 [Helianthus annuus]|nr:hypothetical protein HanRHA438_Chr13g0608401 [Helianthus annuus]